MCGKKCGGCTDCSEKLCTSDITCFDGEFQVIVVPEGSDLNDVLALLETYVTESATENNTFTLVEPNTFGLDAGTYSYQQIVTAVNVVLNDHETRIDTLEGDVNDLEADIIDHEERIDALEATSTILHSLHPKTSSVGLSAQNLTGAGYSLCNWSEEANGTVIEMEFDLHSNGAPPDPIDDGYISFLLNESLVDLPKDLSVSPTLAIPLTDDDYMAVNIKITLTKSSNIEGYVSLVANSSIVSGSFASSSNKYYMSKFIVLATGVGITEFIEVHVKPYANPITLDRVIIKKITP